MIWYERNCETARSTPRYSSVILGSGRSPRSHKEKEVWKSSPRRSRRERTRRVWRDCLAFIRTCHLHRELPHKFQHFRQTLQPKPTGLVFHSAPERRLCRNISLQTTAMIKNFGQCLMSHGDNKEWNTWLKTISDPVVWCGHFLISIKKKHRNFFIAFTLQQFAYNNNFFY